ncbi:LysR family transcriptional regulator [Metasolibacillus meyeri]|uniref:LysR family transcriptional regulator n=1 Tax=Metasolibacillus meyeri TaxID=1071052 RepID=UPI000D2FC4EE|nr:LysR family transcriptional regulator [Metasolibacillus meyeri]
MELKWIQSFVVAAETGNFREAAEKLFISQPSITVHIQLLEESLQVKLFQREHTKIRLSEEGKFFLKQAKEILQQVEDSKRATLFYANQHRKNITIALSPLLVETNLPHIIYQFLMEQKEYEIKITVVDSEQMDEQLLANQVHISIGIGRSSQHLIHAEKIMSSPLQLVVPLDSYDDETGEHHDYHLLFEKYPLFTGHLKEATLIEPLLEKQFPFIRTMTIAQTYIVKHFVKDGLGMAFLPKSIIYKEMMEGRFNIIDFDLFELPAIDIFMKYDKENEQLLPLLKKIRDSYMY